MAAFFPCLRLGRWVLLLALTGCVESYLPDVAGTPSSYLVVDGYINGNGRTRIRLSRSQDVGATAAPPAERGAQVFVADDTGQQYKLTESSPGYYLGDSLRLPAGRQYQLRITTVGTGGHSYQSDPVPLKEAPPIDNLGWRLDGSNSQLNVLLSAHDDNAQSHYYRWKLYETWEFHSAYESFIEYRNGEIQPRVTPIYTCWRTEIPSSIRQASTVQLSRDAVTDQVILSLSARAERLRIRYSVLVGQYTETPAEFAYQEVLRKNTEAVGTVNDPLPAQLTGNVHRVDNTPEPVLGFVGAHTVQFRRLFIDRASLPLPADWKFDSPYASCTLGQELLCSQNNQCIPFPQTLVFNSPGQVPIDYLYDDNNALIGYTGSRVECVDCRQRGTNVKPSFW